MIEVSVQDPEQHNPWCRPFVEYRILAGFLSAEDVPKVRPAAGAWPQEVAARVRSLHGAVRDLPPRPEAGQCRLYPVEEPEALAVLQRVTPMLQFGPNVPVSYSWVEISKLIATSSVADALPQEVAVFNEHPQSLAEYSLLGPPPSLQLVPEGTLYSSSPLNVQDVQAGLQGDQFLFRCRLSLLPRPIVVGYEQERFYLLNEYGRVLQALIGKVDRLLCLVHYGLDLTTPQMRVRLFDPNGGAVNHFGQALLSGNRPPLVKDFLDPTLSAVFPARAPFFMVMPSIQTHQVQFTIPPSAQLPLNISTEN